MDEQTAERSDVPCSDLTEENEQGNRIEVVRGRHGVGWKRTKICPVDEFRVRRMRIKVTRKILQQPKLCKLHDGYYNDVICQTCVKRVPDVCVCQACAWS